MVEQRQRTGGLRKRLVIPIVLAVTTIGTVAAAVSAASSVSGCGDNDDGVDASTIDTPVDTPIV